MNGLFPIIRRVRRPLVVPAEGKPADAKPVVVVVKEKSEPANSGNASATKENNEKITQNEAHV